MLGTSEMNAALYRIVRTSRQVVEDPLGGSSQASAWYLCRLELLYPKKSQ